ncbi:MAG: 3-hydroxyacyl-CoA dehydrogenase family protein [Deltaproteobacteria bacterium]|nr:3-hydroxyacyl-CoA dehydrogenase family protein [Deltaproteobacteria bacterium]
MKIKQVFVVGSGLMGNGIAQVCAQSGINIKIYDVDIKSIEKAIQNITWSVRKLLEKGKIEGSLEAIMNRIQVAKGYEDCSNADLAIEAVFENFQVKKEVFSKLDSTAPFHCLLASNTSAIPITELASCTSRPENVLGLHFFSPVPMMQAVEVIRGAATSDETFSAGREFVETIGKEPIMVHQDVPGFLINRINFKANMEAMRLVESGVGTVEDIDKGLRLAAGRKMGIFEIGDMVGLDVTYGALIATYEETKDPSWYPPQILRRKVKAGHLGRKTGKGWYEYNAEGKRSDH